MELKLRAKITRYPLLQLSALAAVLTVAGLTRSSGAVLLTFGLAGGISVSGAV